MILKNSLLNAYMSLAPSGTHFGMLVSVLFIIGHPENIKDDPQTNDDVQKLFYLSAFTHGLAVLLAIPMKFPRIE